MPIYGDQPTVISNHPPLPVDFGSDSTNRILEGRIMPGDFLGHFELLDYVGGGGMGRVFRASDTRLARIVALKVLSPDQAADAETVQRFQIEAQSAARLDHENIARVHYVGEDRGIHFIAFEFVEGVNVRVLVEQRGPLPLEEVVGYLLQVADALAHADARSVVHRDIKPSNLIITPEGRVKLIDMGLARLREVNSAAADLTASGVTLGTFDYISPEQARDPRNADTRSDIYSLGCTLFFMLAGRPPFLEGTVLQKLLQHQSEQPPSLREFRPDLPEEVDVILQKMLAKDPAKRYSNAGELAFDLLALSEQLGFQPPVPGNRQWLTTVESSPNVLRRHLPWGVSVVALVMIVLGMEIYFTYTAPPPKMQNPPPISIIDHSGASNFLENASSLLPEDNAGRAQASAKGANEKNASALPSRKEEPSPKLHSVANQPFFEPSLSSPGVSDDSNAISKIRSTAESVFEGKKFDAEQPFTGAVVSTKKPFTMNSLNMTPSGFGNSFDNFDGSANASGISAKFGVGSPPENAAKSGGPLIVGDGSGENVFASLGAACAAARSGDIIELHYNGTRVEKPLPIGNLLLTIRGGKGYSPCVAFKPRDADPAKYPRGMFSLRAGRLTISNVSIKLIVPIDILSENWSLFDIRGGRSVRLERCLLTIENSTPSAPATAFNTDTAFFRVDSASDSETATPVVTADAATIEIFNSIARGEAVFLRDEGLQAVNLNWENGMLATSESLLVAMGGMKEPKLGEMLHINLRHLTAATHGGLCRMTASSAGEYQIPVQMNCSDNIFTGLRNNPLIAQEGFGSTESQQRLFIWQGDMNFYDTDNLFWSVRRLNIDGSAMLLNFDDWIAHWTYSRDSLATRTTIEWKQQPGSDQPPHRQTPADYALNRNRENPPLSRSSDGSDAGMNAHKLPTP
jgi:serine/threonine-protein kinase